MKTNKSLFSQESKYLLLHLSMLPVTFVLGTLFLGGGSEGGVKITLTVVSVLGITTPVHLLIFFYRKYFKK
jgi:hypothetical protein